ncbi:uncharacterized protein LOC143192414 [Rhynchophorus ferrugineus]|uniref:uncharacterized protein LOC143192414 n=1 Tax=Rhynchophorus ferrugineus TaxID=354439 RepID=UPI003FCD699D
MRKPLFQLVLIVFYVVLCELNVTGLITCDLSNEDLHIPHPSDCSKYYRCVYGQPVLKICPEKMLFNVEIGNCDLYYNVDCESSEEESTEDLTEVIGNLTTPIQRQLGDTTTNASTTTTRNQKFVYTPHEEEVSAYYMYKEGEKLLMYCDGGMIFDFELEICV